MPAIASDVRQTVRLARRQPGFALIVVLTHLRGPDRAARSFGPRYHSFFVLTRSSEFDRRHCG
jgi:hypothetical protein